jgi:hypothetical protein
MGNDLIDELHLHQSFKNHNNLTFPSIHKQSQHFTSNSNNNHNNIHSHRSSIITTVENHTTNLYLVIYMKKVYIKITCKTQSMTPKNIAANESVFSPQIHEQLLTDAQQHAPHYL